MSQATYPIDERKAKILSTARQTGERSYHLPSENLRITLKPGVTLTSWIDRWVDYQFRNVTTTQSKLINKWKR